jgi:hypothetical protein
MERIMGYKLIMMLVTVANRIAPSERDRSMEYARQGDVIQRVIQPARDDDPAWMDDPVPPPEGILSVPHNYNTSGSRVGTPEEPFEFKLMLRHLPLHCRPGGRNHLLGIIYDFAFQVELRSVFGYALGRVLAPPGKWARRAFMGSFASILARPRFYDEAIVAWNHANPNRQFVPVIPSATLRIQRMDLHESHWRNVTVDDVTTVMILNGIPPSWVAHGYLFGAQYIRDHTTAGSMNAPQYVDIDEDRMRRIREGGLPLAIPEWDGWSAPSNRDIHCIWALIAQERRLSPPVDCFESDAWLYLGEDPLEVPGLGAMPLFPMAGPSGASNVPHQETVEGPEEPMADNPLSASIGALTIETRTTDGPDTVMEEGEVVVETEGQTLTTVQQDSLDPPSQIEQGGH